MGRESPDSARTCVGCRRARDRGDLIRIVRGASGEACFDPEHRLPGRGAYVCPDPGCLALLTPGALGHALHAPVHLPPAGARQAALAAQLERRVANLLTMARRTRGMVFGPAGTRAALRGGRAFLLILARDLSASAAGAWRAQAGEVPVRVPATAAALGALAGREPFTVGAVTGEGFADAALRAIDLWGAILPVSCDTFEIRTVQDAGQGQDPGGGAAGGG